MSMCVLRPERLQFKILIYTAYTAARVSVCVACVAVACRGVGVVLIMNKAPYGFNVRGGRARRAGASVSSFDRGTVPLYGTL